MKETKYNSTFNFIEKTTASIKGGYVGLKILFDKFIAEEKGFGREINHTNFQDFINGKPILIGTTDNYSKSGSPYEFETFYERMFKFEYKGEGYFADKNNILEKIITEIDAIFSKENFLSDNEKKTNLKKVLLIISNEIKKSDNCKEIENPKLYPKLIYIKNGYIKTYDTIYSLYSDYLKGFEKVNFINKVFDESETNNTLDIDSKLALMFADGTIKICNKNELFYNEKIFSGNALAIELETKLNENPKSVKSYLNDTRNDFDGRKNIFRTTNLIKLEIVHEHCKRNKIEVTAYFINKLNKIQSQN